jgi:hypothetical protein
MFDVVYKIMNNLIKPLFTIPFFRSIANASNYGRLFTIKNCLYIGTGDKIFKYENEKLV